MHLELWAPGSWGTAERYDRMLRLHGAFVFAVSAPALLGCFGHAIVDSPRVRAPLVGWLGVACFAMATCALVAMMFTSVHARRLVEVGFPIAGLVTGIHVLMQARGERLAAIGFVISAIAGCVLALVGEGHAAQLATLLAAGALAATTARDGWRQPATWFAIAAIPQLVLAVFAELQSREADTHLHDTYFEVARYHAHAAVLVLAALAALHRWAEPLVGRRPRPRIVLVGLAIVTGAAISHHVEFMQLGGMGMPRRYWDYDPVFAPMQQDAGIAAVVAVVGVAIIAVGWLRHIRSGSGTTGGTR